MIQNEYQSRPGAYYMYPNFRRPPAQPAERVHEIIHRTTPECPTRKRTQVDYPTGGSPCAYTPKDRMNPCGQSEESKPDWSKFVSSGWMPDEDDPGLSAI